MDDIDGQNQDGGTALMTASRYDHIDVVQLLLGYGANPNITNKWGWTALMYAARHHHEDVCLLLLDHGAKISDREYWMCGRTSRSIEMDNLLSSYPQSLYIKRDRSITYMSSTYSDITILVL